MKIYNYTRVLKWIKEAILINTVFAFVILFLSLYFDNFELFSFSIVFNIVLFVLNYAIKSFIMYKVRKLYRSGKIGYNEVKAVGNCLKEESIC